MTVRFVFRGSDSFYSFPSDFLEKYNFLQSDTVPCGVVGVYKSDTEMFSFLDSVVSPSCLKGITMSVDDSETYFCLFYDISHVSLDELERFLIPCDYLHLF